MAQGFSQLPGVDFHHTFSLVVKSSTIRVILALFVQFHWSLHQFDVKNAFLNGILTKPVYMAQPPGFVDHHFHTHVCHLKKALYGLCQAPLAWFQWFSSFLISLGFRGSQSDSSLFYLHRENSIIFLLLYVDDIIVSGSDATLLRRFIDRTHREFKIKNLGLISYFLGLEISYVPDGLFIGLAKYAHDILERASHLDSKPVSMPLASCESLTSSGTPLSAPTMYRSLVEALHYLTITRPDIFYDVNMVSQFLQHPTYGHLLAVKRILRYIKGTLHFGLLFSRSTTSTITLRIQILIGLGVLRFDILHMVMQFLLAIVLFLVCQETTYNISFQL